MNLLIIYKCLLYGSQTVFLSSNKYYFFNLRKIGKKSAIRIKYNVNIQYLKK